MKRIRSTTRPEGWERYDRSQSVFMLERVAPQSFERENRMFLGMFDSLDSARWGVRKRTGITQHSYPQCWSRVDNESTLQYANLVYIITRYRVRSR